MIFLSSGFSIPEKCKVISVFLKNVGVQEEKCRGAGRNCQHVFIEKPEIIRLAQQFSYSPLVLYILNPSR